MISASSPASRRASSSADLTLSTDPASDSYNRARTKAGTMSRMKISYFSIPNRTFLRVAIAGSALLCIAAADSPAPTTTPKPDPWLPLRPLIGLWEGESTGKPGTGQTERSYEFVLNDRFIRTTTRASYPPQEKNPKG